MAFVNPEQGKVEMRFDSTGALFGRSNSVAEIEVSPAGGGGIQTVTNAGDGSELVELPVVDGVLRVRTLESIDSSIDLSQSTNEVNIQVNESNIENITHQLRVDDATAQSGDYTFFTGQYESLIVITIGDLEIILDNTDLPEGKEIILLITPALPSTITLPNTFYFVGGVQPIFTTTTITMIRAVTMDGGNRWMCTVAEDLQL